MRCKDVIKPKVLIVGKANVGKSTLFNRIIGEKKSIVHDLPGVTRDFVYGETEWDGVSFTVIDTCGIFENAQSYIEEKQKSLIFQSREEAALILFVVDGRNGLTSEDFYIADNLKRYSNKVILVANKAENYDKFEIEVKPELYSLGFGDIIPVSAEHNRNITELLDEIVNFLVKHELTSFIEDAEQTSEEIIKVAIVGRPNVGKSSLFNSIIGIERALVSEIPGTTRDSIDYEVEIEGQKFSFIDTAGLRKKSTVSYGSIEMFSISRSIRAIERSDVVVLVVDALEGITRQDKSIIGLAEDRGKASVIVFNKWDLVKNKQQKKEEFLSSIDKEFFFVNYSPIVFTSAAKKWGIDELIASIEEANRSRNKRIQTSLLNAALERYIMASPPPIKKGKRIKFYYAAQVGIRPPVFVFYTNLPNDVPKYYQQGLRNMIRNYVDPFIGSPIFLKFKESKPSRKKSDIKGKIQSSKK
ncbi:MAG TPA: ribosome biogenesis GTPase Der [Defluviitoga tunisiensis]|jgi:GTP-binding protein|nr:ribosome biogenesis GTPase Der [Defluviitoga tunisiensis]